MIWHKQKINVLTPLHIGCSVEYHPIVYEIMNGTISIYDIPKEIKNYNLLKKLSKLIKDKWNKKKGRVELYANNIIQELKINPPIVDTIKLKTDPRGRYVNVREFIHYIDDKRKIRRFVPGSSIKGFLRTVILWNALRKKNPNWIKNNMKDIDRAVFGNPTNDFLKCLLISDSDPIDNKKFSVYVFHRRKKRNPHIKAKGIPVNVICLDPNTEFTFYIKLNRNYNEFKKFCELVDLDSSASDEEIIERLKKLCSEFVGENLYKANMALGFGTGYEYKTIKKILLDPNLFDNLTISQIEKNYKESKIRFLMKNNLKLKIKYKDFPTTVWLVNNVRPGFCKWR